MSNIEQEISSIKAKLLQREALVQYIPSKDGTSPIPKAEEERKLILYSAWDMIMVLSSMPFAGMTDPFIELLELLGERAYPRAYYELGLLFYHGEFVNKDLERSYNYHLKAAEAGYADAQFELYVYLSKGIGCAINEAEALKWNLKAVEQGQHRAQYNMGAFYATGSNGLPLDMQKAVEWYEKAASNGNAQAAKTLGTMFYAGQGVASDKDRGLLYLQRTAELDPQFARQKEKYIQQLDNKIL